MKKISLLFIGLCLLCLNAFTQKLSIDKQVLQYSEELQTFYKTQNYQSVWVTENGFSERAFSFKRMIDRYAYAGEKYPTIQKQLQTLFDIGAVSESNQDALLKAELNISELFFSFLHQKYSNSTEIMARWMVPPVYENITDKWLELERTKKQLPPNPELYTASLDALQQQAEKYVSMWKNNAVWGNIPVPENVLKTGSKNPCIPLVKQRLSILQNSAIDTDSLFTPALATEILAFQSSRGLDKQAVINADLIAHLNVPLITIAETILINIDRMKWLPEVNFSEHLLVNIPEFNLYFYQDKQLIWVDPVIVGKPATPTALFSGQLQFIVFSPYWNIPTSILNKEIIPKVKSNPNYLDSQHLEVVDNNGNIIPTSSIDWSLYPEQSFPYSIRQNPGDDNALGYIKFLFPNEYNIYMHDTPSRSLLEKSYRAFSHGCIRIKDPEKLATLLLAPDSTWTTDKIETAMYSGTQQWVPLLPSEIANVAIVYYTAWVNQDGTLNLRKDLYNYDNQWN